MNAPIRFRIRGSARDDEDDLLRVAGFLDSVNLPNDRSTIRELLAISEESFSGGREDLATRQYVFVLEDLEAGRIIGTSMIIGQKGRKGAPYIYFRVKKDEKYSPHLDRHFVHQVLELAFSYAGPTELGGLVMDPAYRRSPERLGRLISYVRFLFIAAHRSWFREQLLAELMPPLEPDGTSRLWEAIGRHFTGLSYQEADKLSKHNKEFIRRLFPSEDIYASLISEEAQAVIGQVGRETRGVEKLLRRIGFRYVNRVDPFDGGPHFLAETDEVTLIQRACETRFVPSANTLAERQLLMVLLDRSPWLVAISAATGGAGGNDEVGCSSEALALLSGAKGWRLPLKSRPPVESSGGKR